MPRWLKWILGVLLLPVCLGASQALFWLLRESTSRLDLPGGTDVVWVPLLAGAACWWVVYLLLPKPMWVYVVGHELTHVLWTWLFGGRVKRFRATSQGGHVVVTKVNFLITLAPYFFPLYAALVVVAYALGSLWGALQPYRAGFLLLLGASYAFHLTLTWHALKTEQTDITSQGYLFSAVVLWLGNVGLLLVGLPVLLDLPLSPVFRELVRGTWAVLRGAAGWLGF